MVAVRARRQVKSLGLDSSEAIRRPGARAEGAGDDDGLRGGVPDDGRAGGGTGLVVEEQSPRLKRPPLYQVVLLNDDYTPMEFVVDVLQRIFGMDRVKATRVMLEVHTKGKGVCGVYTFEIAETKVAQVTAYARQHQHPLLCTMEETG
ncbi:MAG: ATP-dependent Clp protease adapter ClpS [Pseudomonadota bacterium]|jgi:ATP-dependent Clp protease adaptor protein ClpS